MARRVWMSSVAAAAVLAVALAWGPSSADRTSAKAEPTEPSIATTTSTTVARPASTSSTSVASTSTTSTSTTTTTTTTTSATTTTIAPRRDAPFDSAKFDAAIAAGTVDRGDISAGVAVIRNGKVLHTAAFGMENPFESVPATTRTRFRLASLSKMMTAVAILQLVDDGKIDLDQPFAAQMGLNGPFTDPRVATVTVHQLLSHTSGFGASRGIFFGHGVNTWHEAATAAIGQVLKFDPGTAFEYSNANYCILGELLEAVTGDSFESVIRERVLEPIDAQAHLAPTVDTNAGDALHATSPGRNYMEVLGPAGGWVATPLDVAKLAAALRFDSAGDHLLDATTVDAMRVPVPVPVEIPPPVSGWSYGMGLILFADGSWGHTGTIESTHASVVNRPDGLTIAVLVSGKIPGNTDDLLPMIDAAVAASAT